LGIKSELTPEQWNLMATTLESETKWSLVEADVLEVGIKLSSKTRVDGK